MYDNAYFGQRITQGRYLLVTITAFFDDEEIVKHLLR